MKRTHCASVFLMLLVLPASGTAGWSADQDRSSVTYLSTKMTASFQTVFERNHFKRFSAAIDDAGEATLIIELNSVHTGVLIRDERIREHVFDTGNHPQATVKLPVGDLAKYYPPGYTQMVNAKLAMRGAVQKVEGEVSIVYNGDDLMVQTTEPVLVNAVDYGMLDGFGKLKELVGLFNIPTTIPVSFKLVFVKK